jgi:hypothetical protein
MEQAPACALRNHLAGFARPFGRRFAEKSADSLTAEAEGDNGGLAIVVDSLQCLRYPIIYDHPRFSRSVHDK